MVADDDELLALRRRAYGRDADIHADDAALARLRELEDRARPAPAPPADAPVDVSTRAAPGDEPADALADPTLPDRVELGRERILPVVRRIAAVRPRRSTVLLGLGALALAAILATTLTVVQRVQTDPLNTGARQVARVSVDRSFTVPLGVLGESAAKRSHGFDVFHGLRFLLVPYPDDSRPVVDRCLYVASAEALRTYDPNDFHGFVAGDCAAGGFAPAASFRLDATEVPKELRASYPDATALDVVYDRQHDEVVVFSDG